ncbi:uncharacterized protein [Diadema setosum]|uniref:uncharacterized protein n=1 Tax=Diadema setosum TaxID=31175 RepID=UPI003B3A80B4
MFGSSSHGSSNQPAEVFRKDLISAMKLPDSYQLQPDEYMIMTDNWKPEWEKGVQVPVSPDCIPHAQLVEIRKPEDTGFKLPKKLIKGYDNHEEEKEESTDGPQKKDATCQYDLDEVDVHWLQLANEMREEIGDGTIDEFTMERIIEECDIQCNNNVEHAMLTEEGLGIEYDEDVICDVCRAPDSEEGNEMVFCDKCDICVHQACYGIVKVPEGSWMCRTCALGIQPPCILCGIKGGAMKSTRSGTKWAHVSCALWVPEVSIGCVERMEPITKISQIPASRWALICNICRVRTGACIQCSVKTCKTAYHVTCGFENGLEMKTFLDDEADVRFRSYCLKHTKAKREMDGFDPKLGTPEKAHGTPKKEMTQEEKANERALRIQVVTEEFYRYAKMKEVAAALNMKDDIDTVDMVYEYWKLKRKSGHNRPLVTPTKEVGSLGSNEEYNLTARMKMFVHLRQDLERVRNLCYMVQRREKLSRQLGILSQSVFRKQCDMYSAGKEKFSEKDLAWAIRIGKFAPFLHAFEEGASDASPNKCENTKSDKESMAIDEKRTIETPTEEATAISNSHELQEAEKEEEEVERRESAKESDEETERGSEKEPEEEKPSKQADTEVKVEEVEKMEESEEADEIVQLSEDTASETNKPSVKLEQMEEEEESPPRSRESSVSCDRCISPLSADADESEVADDSEHEDAIKAKATRTPPPEALQPEDVSEGELPRTPLTRNTSKHEAASDAAESTAVTRVDTPVETPSVSPIMEVLETKPVLSEEQESRPPDRPSLKRKISLKAIREAEMQKNGKYSPKKRKRDSHHRKSKYRNRSDSDELSDQPVYSIVRTPTRDSPSKISIKIHSPTKITPRKLQMDQQETKIRERVLSMSSPRGSLKSYRIPKKKPVISGALSNGPPKKEDPEAPKVDPFEFIDELEEPVHKPETRSRRKLIEDELDSESSCSERQFENIDGEVSMCVPGRESPFKGGGEENVTPASFKARTNNAKEERLGKKRNLGSRIRDATVRFLSSTINL